MKTTRQKLQDRLWENFIQEEARIANDLQRDHPDMPRSEAQRDDLLEALKECADELEAHETDIAPHDMPSPALQRARAAIAKATGGTE